MKNTNLTITYSILAALLSTLSCKGSFLTNFIITTLVILISIDLPQIICKKLSKTKISFFILFIASAVFFNLIIWFLTDHKDFTLLLILEAAWGVFGIVYFILNKFFAKKDNGVFHEILKFYLSFFVLILIERLINCTKMFEFNIDTFHIVNAIIIWRILEIVVNFGGALCNRNR